MFRIKDICILILLVFSTAVAQQKKPIHKYRPAAEFYEKGKEVGRGAEYQKHKESKASKRYQKLFSHNLYTTLSIYKVSNYHMYGKKVKLSSVKLHERFSHKDETFKEFENFLKKVFPEKVNRMPKIDARSILLVFEGENESCVIYIPVSIWGPEFAILEAQGKKVEIGTIYEISDYAMSATPPSEYFWKLWK